MSELPVAATPADRELPLLLTGMGPALAHNLDEAFGHPEAGGRLNLVLGLVVLGLLVAVRGRLRPTWKAVIYGVLGLNAVLQGLAGHVAHIVSGDATPLDWTGILFVLGGLVLVWLAVVVWRQRDVTVESVQP